MAVHGTTNILKTLGLIGVIAMTLSSCVKTPGCIDPNASNYLFEAQKDDGSCLYDMHFWLNTARYEGVEIYVDDIFRGTINCVVSSAPRCGVDDFSNGTLRCNVLVPLNTGWHHVRVEAFDGTIFEDLYFLPENCLMILITDHN